VELYLHSTQITKTVTFYVNNNNNNIIIIIIIIPTAIVIYAFWLLGDALSQRDVPPRSLTLNCSLAFVL